ncbi:acyl-CoA dehydrogenase [Nitrospirillum sp. BR 11164]|uniref:acyl-CoA dehydrogenase family protein n=1 Tax=Nitrospirillum sp. BR 11164 TaxID=3104324 RepID=UPI002AFE2B19|nr:acyl-CoA dehydrogenase [Nitrospirillum sp. BR 11164]MEA1652853.1 acyl-CoA dehydrogenase [Nitrospirillum sp. BR 11164]
MDFDLTDEQRLLSETLGRFVADRYDFHERPKKMAEGRGYSKAVWDQLAELGVLGLPFAEQDGGFGGGGVETLLVMEALGKGLMVEPYFGAILLAGGALRLAGSPAQKGARLEGIIAGQYLMALAHAEPDGLRHTVDQLRTTAMADGDGWRLTGVKTAVIAGDSADELIVSAATPAGVTLFLVDPQADGVTIVGHPGYDGIRVADVRLHGVAVPANAVLGGLGGGAPILTRLFEEATAALVAEAVGIMADTLNITVDYLKTRSQFGVAIGSFQALQHRAVDMMMQVELARSMAILAALALDMPDEERRLNIAAAKAKVGQAARFVGQQAVQLHGAIGLTLEYKIGHAFKRLTAIDAWLGDADHHLDVIAEAGGLPAIA